MGRTDHEPRFVRRLKYPVEARTMRTPMPNPNEELFEQAICDSLTTAGGYVAVKNDLAEGAQRDFDPVRGLDTSELFTSAPPRSTSATFRNTQKASPCQRGATPCLQFSLRGLSLMAANNSFKPSPLRGLGPTGAASGGPA